MKKIITIIIFLALAVMFTAGCVIQVEGETADRVAKKLIDTDEKIKGLGDKLSGDENSAEEKTEDSVASQKIDDEEQGSLMPVKPMTKEMEKMLSNHEGRITSMRYMYQDPLNHPQEWETWVKDDKMHLDLRELHEYNGKYFDHVYLDLRSRSATAYCEQKIMRCEDPNEALNVPFSDFFRETPVDWVENIDYAEKIAEEQKNYRNMWKIQYKDGDKIVSLWLDEYYGVPAEIEILESGKKTNYIFEDLKFNSVEEKNLAHQYITDKYNVD